MDGRGYGNYHLPLSNDDMLKRGAFESWMLAVVTMTPRGKPSLSTAICRLIPLMRAAARKITSVSHLSGAFEVVARSQCDGIAPSRRLQNPSEICDLSVNIFYGTALKLVSFK